ncbi:MAG: transposase [Nitrososphaerota archaeon]
MRYPSWVRGLAVRMYVEGLSLRRVAEVLGELGFRVSHESVRRWFLRAGEAFSLVDRRRRGPIAVDETVIRNLVRRAYLWAAREVGRGIRHTGIEGSWNRGMHKVHGECKEGMH